MSIYLIDLINKYNRGEMDIFHHDFLDGIAHHLNPFELIRVLAIDKYRYEYNSIKIMKKACWRYNVDNYSKAQIFLLYQKCYYENQREHWFSKNVPREINLANSTGDLIYVYHDGVTRYQKGIKEIEIYPSEKHIRILIDTKVNRTIVHENMIISNDGSVVQWNGNDLGDWRTLNNQDWNIKEITHWNKKMRHI